MDFAESTASPISSSQFNRSFERLLEEAQYTGELNLSSKKCREFPEIVSKYELEDTITVDLSKNRLAELPQEVCQYISLEVLNCYHNVIRFIPDVIIQLQYLTHLNISRNQMTILPASLCRLSVLEVLIVSHNKLVSIPEEISQLRNIMELDVSCNEISHLPQQIGYINSLRFLNLRRNLLVELPMEITMLRLNMLDISSNRIVFLPLRLRFMDSLIELNLENNPLSSPTAFLCSRGKVHIFKYLEIQALKQDRKKDILGFDQYYRCSTRKQATQSIDDGRTNQSIILDNDPRRHTLESGYSISCVEKGWPRDTLELCGDSNEVGKTIDIACRNTTPNSINRRSPPHSEVEHRKKINSVLEHQQPKSKESSGILEASSVDLYGSVNPEITSGVVSPMMERKNPYGHVQTYREYKEALRMQRNFDANEVYRRTMLPDGSRSSGYYTEESQGAISNLPSVSSNNAIMTEGNSMNSVDGSEDVFDFDAKLQLQEEKRKQKQFQKEAVLSYYKSRTSPTKSASSESDRCNSSTASTPNGSPLPPQNSTQYRSPVQRSLVTSPTCNKKDSISNEFLPVNDVSRKTRTPTKYQGCQGKHSEVLSGCNKVSENTCQEKEQLHLLKRVIEARLKVVLPDDLGSALMDGVVLCHLANHVRPRSVASIHVPSPSVPKLTMAKCRRNVENFLEACRIIGVPKAMLCSSSDILDGLADPRKLLFVMDGPFTLNTEPTEQRLLHLFPKAPSQQRPSRRTQDDSLLSLMCLFLFVGSSLLLYFLPRPS